jgi:hypothetical protein
MMNEPLRRSRPFRAALVGVASDQADSVNRMTRLPNGTVLGGSRQTHDHLREIALRLEVELDRLGVGLEELSPPQLAEVAWRIDSPEMFEFAVHLDHGLRRRDLSFHDSTPEVLMEISLELVSGTAEASTE